MGRRFKNYIGLSIIILALVIGACGCEMNLENKTGNSENLFTERQKEILASRGLSADYNELTSNQKAAITAIEEMFSYLDAKYNIEFIYSGYIPHGANEEERLMVYPKGGDSQTDSFAVRRNADGSFSDDYMFVALRSGYSDLVRTLVCRTFETESIKVYSEVTKTELSAIPTKEDEYLGKIEGSSVIFIDESSCSKAEFSSNIQFLKEQLMDNGLYGSFQAILIKSETLKLLTQYNYTSYLNDSSYTMREIINVQR